MVLALLTGMEAGGGAAQHGVGGPGGVAGVVQGIIVWYHVAEVWRLWYHVVEVGL